MIMDGGGVKSERLFLALYPRPEIVSRLEKETAALARRYPLPGLRWIPASHLHLTLLFLGEVTNEQRRELIPGLEQLADRQRPFDIAPASYAYFPNRKRARVFYLALRESGPLRELAGEIGHACREVVSGASATAFRPHITLARMGRRFKAHDALPAGGQPAPWQQRVDRFHLVKSDLSAGGAKYTVVHTFFLPETK